MTAVATRLVVFAGTTPNPREPSAPQRDLVQGVVGVRLDPQAVQYTEGPLTPPADFWDFLTDPNLDHSGYVVLYEAELYDDGTIIVKRDLFGKNDLPHTFAGWPIPGDEFPLPDPNAPPEARAVPKTVVLTAAEKKALACIRKKRNGYTGGP